MFVLHFLMGRLSCLDIIMLKCTFEEYNQTINNAL